MKLSFFLGDIQKIGQHGKLSFDRNGAERTQQCGNVFSGVFRLNPPGEFLAWFLI
jgi:hypothetical protein